MILSMIAKYITSTQIDFARVLFARCDRIAYPIYNLYF